MLCRVLASMEQDEAGQAMDDIDPTMRQRMKNPNRNREYMLQLQGSTIQWIMEVVRMNLQRATERKHETPVWCPPLHVTPRGRSFCPCQRAECHHSWARSVGWKQHSTRDPFHPVDSLSVFCPSLHTAP